ncbi:MAG TPA: hypothetical protein VGO50_13180 [Pyrinomonadaceae bacterium]|jgi:hypothetical protein|nr:hypothetical protein [Pyrinomonadaceae bacterium]
MRSKVFVLTFVFVLASSICAQTAAPTPAQNKPVSKSTQVFDLSEQGIKIEPDKRLIVLMAALDAAGFDPTPGREPSVFRRQLHEDLQNLNPDLRRRLKEFFERGNKMRNRNTPAEQSAPYITMVYSLSPLPELADPLRTDDLPGELLDVLDFAPLLREFYRRSAIEEKMPDYVRAYQAAADGMRPSAIEMARDLLSYLHTRPEVEYTETVKTQVKEKGKSALQKVEQKRHTRRFFIVPDLLSVPGTVNFRNIGDDYYAVAPPNTDLTLSEVRRAYLQFVIDPLVLKNSKDLVPFRDGIKKLLDEREKKGAPVSPDVFLSVTRSLVAAAEAREDEFVRVRAATYIARQQIDQAKDDNAKRQISKQLADVKAQLADETSARLSEAYETGAVLSFYFAEQLKGIEESGFDISGALQDMILSLDPSKESDRLTQNAEARKRAVAARDERKRKAQIEVRNVVATSARDRALETKLKDVTELIGQRSFDGAESRLRDLQVEFPGEPKIFYYRGLAADLSAAQAIDETVRDERLNRAAAHYRSAILSAQSSDVDKVVLSQAHFRLGRILEFNEQIEAAKAEYEATIKVGDISGGAKPQAVAAMQRLVQKP